MDEDDDPRGFEGDDVDDVLHVEALMGWDGDRCGCTVCDCPRFIDEAGEAWCRDCRAARHWPAGSQ